MLLFVIQFLRVDRHPSTLRNRAIVRRTPSTAATDVRATSRLLPEQHAWQQIVADASVLNAGFREPRTVTIFSGRICWLRSSIRSTVWENRLIKDALTIVVGVHISRQQGQVRKHLRLKAGADFLQRLFDLRLRYRFGPPDHRIQFETWNRVFFGELSRFLLPEF